MSGHGDDRQAIADQLVAAGVGPVSLDRGQAPPMVLVGMPTGDTAPPALGVWRVTCPITIVWLPPGDSANTEWAFGQLELILTALGWAPYRPVTFGDDDNPAYQLTYPRTIPNPLC